jgi:hypothetical protein
VGSHPAPAGVIAVALSSPDGFTHSGSGKDLSMSGFEDYTRVQHVMSFIGA